MDPDAILYAERLRGHLQWHVGQQLGFRKLWSRYVTVKERHVLFFPDLLLNSLQ